MDSIEELAHRWRWIFKTLSDGIRRRIIGSVLEAPIGRELSLPEAANMPEYRLDPKKLRSTFTFR